MRIESVKCDMCGIQKQETNHWLYAKYRNESIHFSVGPEESPGYSLDICGEECAHKILSQWLNMLQSKKETLAGTKPSASIVDSSCETSTD
jgi:hypothetical protein